MGPPVNEDVGVLNGICGQGDSRVNPESPDHYRLHQRIWEEISHGFGSHDLVAAAAAMIASSLVLSWGFWTSSALAGRGDCQVSCCCVGSG